MASEKERAAAQKQAVKDEKARFAEWKKLQEEAGYTVEGDSLETAKVLGLPEGPTFNDTPGA